MKKDNLLFSGVMPALVSCIDEDQNVMEDSMCRLMDYHLSCGVTGFYICGGTGEGPVLQMSTRKRIAEIAKSNFGDRCKLIDHVGAIDLASAKELARHAGKIGVDAISSVPPFFFDYGEREIKQYYEALANESGLPVIMYATPMAGVNVTVDMVEHLMEIPGMAGIKWTSYDYYTMHRIKELCDGNINVLNGPDECLLCGLAMGADGGIGSTYNIMPKTICGIYDAFRAGDIEKAQQLQFKANKLIHLLIKHDVVCGIKDALEMVGYPSGYQVYPQKRFTDEEREAFRNDLKAIDFENEYFFN